MRPCVTIGAHARGPPSTLLLCIFRRVIFQGVPGVGGDNPYRILTIKIKNVPITGTGGTLQPIIRASVRFIFGGISAGRMEGGRGGTDGGCTGFPQRYLCGIVTDWLTRTRGMRGTMGMWMNMTVG